MSTGKSALSCSIQGGERGQCQGNTRPQILVLNLEQRVKFPATGFFLLDRDPGDDAGRALGGGRGGGARGKRREGGKMRERGVWESRFWSNRAADSYVINILIEVF